MSETYSSGLFSRVIQRSHCLRELHLCVRSGCNKYNVIHHWQEAVPTFRNTGRHLEWMLLVANLDCAGQEVMVMPDTGWIEGRPGVQSVPHRHSDGNHGPSQAWKPSRDESHARRDARGGRLILRVQEAEARGWGQRLGPEVGARGWGQRLGPEAGARGWRLFQSRPQSCQLRGADTGR